MIYKEKFIIDTITTQKGIFLNSLIHKKSLKNLSFEKAQFIYNEEFNGYELYNIERETGEEILITFIPVSRVDFIKFVSIESLSEEILKILDLVEIN